MTRKRLSQHGPTNSKRAKGDDEEHVNLSVSDSIPLRSREFLTLKLEKATILSYFTRPSGYSTSFSTSAPSSKNTSFSPSIPSKNTSFSSANDAASDEDDLLSEYFSTEDFWSQNESDTLTPAVTLSPETLDKKLKDVWPRFCNESFSNAPLPIVWEITRIAQHCAVKLADCDLQYDNNSPIWNDQARLREMLKQLIVFQHKTFPQVNNHDAWGLGLKEFQSPGKSKAVKLSGELHLNVDSHGPLFSLKLSPLAIDTSHRLSRRFGADRFLEIIMPSLTHIQKATKCDNVVIDSVVRWLTGKKHYFLGRQWMAFYCREAAKSKSFSNESQSPPVSRMRIFLFACDGDSFRLPLDGILPPPQEAQRPAKRTKVTRYEMMSWAVGSLRVVNQQVPKLFSRISLSLTRTWSTVILERGTQIYDAESDIGQLSPMNDGIGRISRSLATKVSQSLGLTEVPSAYQGRFGSAKGIWIIHQDPELGNGDWIVTYPSQRKWNCDYEDVHHRTFEVKEWSKEPKAAALNQQFIPLLEAQAINANKMRKTIAAHLRHGLLEDLGDQAAAMCHSEELRGWLHKGGGSRASRNDNHSCIPYLGALPQAKEDVVKLLLDTGFEPTESKYLQELCWELASTRADNLKKKFNIQVPCSVYLYMVVDFSGILEENEVHVSFSTKFKAQGFCDTLLEDMDILVARNPAHQPSDIQRVRVVSKPQLRHLKDVIVFSIKGAVSLADKLSGGDYDGDRAWVCWDQDIVQNFQNAPVPLQIDDMDPVKMGYMEKLDRPMSQIRAEESKDDDICAKFVYEAFTFNMQQTFLGQCTMYKDRYCYHKGSVTSRETIVLSKILGNLVDQSKQGFLFTQSDWEKFRKEELKSPKFLPDPEYIKDRPSAAFSKVANPHVLDYLRYSVAEETIQKALIDFEKSLGTAAQHYDADLTKMFNWYDEKFASKEEWIRLKESLRKGIERVASQWKEQINFANDVNENEAKVHELHEMWWQIQPPLSLRTSEFTVMLLDNWSCDHHSTTWALLKASYAFKLFCNHQSRFVWRMAGHQLAVLKQKVRAGHWAAPPVTVKAELYALLRPDTKAIERRRVQRLAMAGVDLTAADVRALDYNIGGIEP